MAKGWTVVRMIMIFLFYVLSPPKGETTHYILRVASAPSTTAVTDSLDFQVADAPLQIQFASAKCVRCASLRSGGRRLAVRKMIECHIFAQPRTPFCHYVAFPLKGKREIWREKQGCIYFMYHSGVPSLVAGATTFPPQFGGAAKGKRLNGQARHLTSPHLEVLCRTSTVAL